jgi:hypothetical protein
MLLAKDNESGKTFQLDRFNEPLATSIQIGAGLRQWIGS